MLSARIRIVNGCGRCPAACGICGTSDLKGVSRLTPWPHRRSQEAHHHGPGEIIGQRRGESPAARREPRVPGIWTQGEERMKGT